MPAIEVEELRKRYGPVEALRGISFSIEEGEVVAVLGPNGAGKTTAIEILEGYRRRDAGRVSVLGVDPARGGAAWRQRVGVVLQSSAADPYLTVAEIVTMYAQFYDAPRPVDDVLALVGLSDRRGARVKTLSGGQQRRLDVALGLIGDPDLLFLDEPTTGFDPTARRQAWDVVRNLRTLGTTVLLTTHYMDEAQALADRVLVVAGGRVVAEGPPDSIGGRAEAAARIEFALADGVAVGDLPVAAVAVRGGGVVVETADVVPTLHALTAWAMAHGHDLPGLRVTRPSLEDVYLTLTEEAEP